MQYINYYFFSVLANHNWYSAPKKSLCHDLTTMLYLKMDSTITLTKSFKRIFIVMSSISWSQLYTIRMWWREEDKYMPKVICKTHLCMWGKGTLYNTIMRLAVFGVSDVLVLVERKAKCWRWKEWIGWWWWKT